MPLVSYNFLPLGKKKVMWEESKIWDGLLTTMEGGAELSCLCLRAGLIWGGGCTSPPLSLVLPPQTSPCTFSSKPNPPQSSRASSNLKASDSPLLPLRSLVYPILNAFIRQILIEHLRICREALGSKKPQASLTRLIFLTKRKVSLDKFRVKLSGTLMAFQHTRCSWLSDGELGLQASNLHSKQK